MVVSMVTDSDLGTALPYRPCVGIALIAPSGGVSLTGDSDAEIDTQRLDLLAYARTPAEANRLCATATRRLLMIRREAFAGTFIHWVKRAGGFSQARDRDGQWPMAFRSFQLLYSLKEVQ